MSVANSSNITTIQILRSYSNTTPTTLDDGQLAYSFVSNTLYIGSNTGVKIIGDPSTAVKSQAAYDQANTATVLANGAYFHANGAFLKANAAFDNSNTKLSLSGGTITGPISGPGESKLDFTTYGPNTAYLTTTNDDSTALFMGAVTAELYADTSIQIRANTGGTSKAWTFGDDGSLTFPDNTILNPVDEDLSVVARDSDGVVSSSLEMSPGDTLTRLEQWSSQDSESFNTSDWSTGVYTNQGGLGAVQFTGAANIVDFIDSLVGTGHIFFTVNGGPLLFLDGTSSGATDITFYTPTLPAVNPTTVTSFEYFYSYKSGFEIDYDSAAVNIYANDADITLLTTGQRDISLDSSGEVTITANSASTWTFGSDGSLTFPDNTIQNTAFTGSAIDQNARNLANAAFNQANTTITISQLKSIAANAATYGDFQTAIASL